MNEILNEVESMIQEFDNVPKHNGHTNHGTWHIILWAINDDDMEKKAIQYMKENGNFSGESAKKFISNIFNKYPFDWEEIAEGLNSI